MIYFYDENFNLSVLNRSYRLFEKDLKENEKDINEIINNSSFLVLGGAGTIGSATVKEIFKRNPKLLHVVDISENNLAELVRDIRSSYGYIDGEFKTFALDIGSYIFDGFINGISNHIGNFNKYDYVLNFSALKHVRSEKDPYTLMRMIEVNILNTIKTIEQSIKNSSKKYFCVSTDKATNPVNMMGASKRIMELFLIKYSDKINISTARFANVAFSDGSLLFSFIQRIMKKQPIVAPDDVKRYFITKSESGILCLLSTLLGENKDIFFPKLDEEKDMITFWELALRFLNILGFEPHICETEEEARNLMKKLPDKKKWPCIISKSDTTGEKEFEEFYTKDDFVNFNKFKDIGILKLNYALSLDKLEYFLQKIEQIKENNLYKKEIFIELFEEMLPEFKHIEKGKNLDQKM